MAPLTFASRSRFGRTMLRTTFITIAALLVLFIAVVAIVQNSVRHVIAQQEAVRRAENARALTLRLQIDEETGLRGFIITGERGFLAPFEQARKRMNVASSHLRARLSIVAPPLVFLAQQDREVNARWLSTIALPAIAQRSTGAREAFELRGKSLMDHYRNVSAAMALALSRTADAEDRAAAVTVARIFAASVLFGLVLAAALVFYAAAQIRLAHELSAQGEEYERVERIATLLQQAFLAEPLPRDERLSFDARYIPATDAFRLGGDWYDVRALAGGLLYFSIGDVAGHGIEAAIAMTSIRQAIFAIAVRERDPSLILAHANDVLRLGGETIVTACCGFVDPATFEIAYASAGHPPPLLVGGSGDALFLPARGAPLGVASDPAVRALKGRAAPGSMLVLYTDGIIEFDRDIARGQHALQAAAVSVARRHLENPAGAIVERTLAGATPRDDVAVLTITFAPELQDRRIERESADFSPFQQARDDTIA